MVPLIPIHSLVSLKFSAGSTSRDVTSAQRYCEHAPNSDKIALTSSRVRKTNQNRRNSVGAGFAYVLFQGHK